MIYAYHKQTKALREFADYAPVPESYTVTPPPAPSKGKVVYWKGRWVVADEYPKPPQPCLEDIKAAKLNAIHAEKNRARDAGFTVDGVLFDSDTQARVAYLELEMQLDRDPAYSVQWKASEGLWVTMNAELYAQVKAAGQAHIENCFAWQAAREAEVEAAATVDEVRAVSEGYE